MKVLVLTAGAPPYVASTQFRIVQFIGGLEEHGIFVTLAAANEPKNWPELGNFDLVVLQKRLLRLSWIRELRRGAKVLVYDTDDAIWEPHGKKHSFWTRVRTNARIRATSHAADACSVPNEYLAAYLRPIARKVEWIPMALDETIWRPEEQNKRSAVRIGWAGAPPNLPYLTRLGPALADVQALRPEVEVHVYCGEAPEWPALVKSIYHPYAPGTETEVVRTFDIGLLPLPDDAFAAGKSPIKALQYAACGIPCIASPVGATREIVKDGITGLMATSREEWRDAMLRLIDNLEERRQLGQAARENFLAHHARAQVQAKMVSFWRTVAGMPAPEA